MLQVTGYYDELKSLVELNDRLFKSFEGCCFLISGAAGLIGSYVIDLLVVANRELGLSFRVLACDRNERLLCKRFTDDCDIVQRCVGDVCTIDLPNESVDYVIHAASNTSPVDYATKPIDTIRSNIFGTNRLCEYALTHGVKRFLFCSSVEAYGRNNGDVDFFTEDYNGYVDCNTVRAGYPASKRCSEALLNAYASENPSFDFVTARIGRFYGPTVIPGDSKAPSQFIRNAVDRENIVLKSAGTQLFSWGYVADCATAILTILALGEKGNAYNIADPGSCAMLKQFAAIAAEAGNGKLEFVEQSAVEQAGYSKISKATLDVTKLLNLGWRAEFSLENGIPRTVGYLRELQKEI